MILREATKKTAEFCWRILSIWPAVTHHLIQWHLAAACPGAFFFSKKLWIQTPQLSKWVWSTPRPETDSRFQLLCFVSNGCRPASSFKNSDTSLTWKRSWMASRTLDFVKENQTLGICPIPSVYGISAYILLIIVANLYNYIVRTYIDGMGVGSCRSIYPSPKTIQKRYPPWKKYSFPRE